MCVSDGAQHEQGSGQEEAEGPARCGGGAEKGGAERGGGEGRGDATLCRVRLTRVVCVRVETRRECDGDKCGVVWRLGSRPHHTGDLIGRRRGVSTTADMTVNDTF